LGSKSSFLRVSNGAEQRQSQEECARAPQTCV
jgi:hypothetical protein